MTTTLTIAPVETVSYTSVEHNAEPLDHQNQQEPSNLVVLPSSNYLLSNLSVIRDVKTPGFELARAFKRVATQIIAQGKSNITATSRNLDSILITSISMWIYTCRGIQWYHPDPITF
jgi:hypothetical protein